MDHAKRIYDDIHGFIRLSPEEAKIVDSPYLQRLRRIKQLSTAYLVYPGATHSRFSHALGSMAVMERAAGRLAEQGFIPRDDVELLKLAALLHDVGSLPYTHALEPLYIDRARYSTSELREDLLRRTELRDLISRLGVSVDELIALYEDKHPNRIYTELLNGDIGVRRLDYLPRDARHTGVAYGLIDVDRILETLSVDEAGGLAVSLKGLHAAENFYVARLHMYQAVYYHKTIIGYELLLSEIYSRLAEEAEDMGDVFEKSWLESLVETGMIAYWDDYWLHSKLYQALESHETGGETRRLIRMFLDRGGLKVLVDLSRLSNKPSSSRDYVRLEEYRKKAEEEGVKTYPFADDIAVSMGTGIRILLDGRSLPIDSEELNALPRYLPRYYVVLRLYVDPLYRDKLRRMLMSQGTKG